METQAAKGLRGDFAKFDGGQISVVNVRGNPVLRLKQDLRIGRIGE